MPHRTNPFQKLSTSIMAAIHGPNYVVKESVLEVSKNTGLPREIDILITGENYKVLVECRAHKRKQDVQWIDALDGKSRSLGINKVIAISESGFTKGALKEASARKIETMTLSEAENINWHSKILSILKVVLCYDEIMIKEVGLISEGGPVRDLGNINTAEVYIINLSNGNKTLLSECLPKLLNHKEIQTTLMADRGKNQDKEYRFNFKIPFKANCVINNHVQIPVDRIGVAFTVKSQDIETSPKHLMANDKEFAFAEININDNNFRFVIDESSNNILNSMFEIKHKQNNPITINGCGLDINMKTDIKKNLPPSGPPTGGSQ